jgi:hypothetical protein
MAKRVQFKTVEVPKIIVMDFHGDKVEGVRVKVAEETRDYFGLKRICENLGLLYDRQRAKLPQIQDIFGKDAVVQVKAPAPDGKMREQTALERRAMYYFLANLSPSKVKPEVREKLKLYIRELFDAWDKYIQSGQASQEVREFLGVATEGAKVSRKAVKEAKPVELSPIEIDEKISKFLNSASRFINSLVKAGEEPAMVKQVARKLALKTLGLEDVELTIELTDYLRSKKELDSKKLRHAVVSFGHYLTKQLPEECKDGKIAKVVNGAVRQVNAYKFECHDKIESLYQEWIKDKGKKYLKKTPEGGSESTNRRSF